MIILDYGIRVKKEKKKKDWDYNFIPSIKPCINYKDSGQGDYNVISNY